MMEELDFENFKVSIKSTSVPNTIGANRLLAQRIDYPIHLGVTESGTKWSGSLKSAVGLGTLLAEGVGDTIRISLSTFQAEEEVKVAWEILKALQLRERGPVLIACPTCGRLQFDMDTVVAEIERRLERYEQPIEVAVLGCAVNGIGEASHADFGITGAKNEGMIFAHGKPLRKVPQDRLVDELFAEIDKSLKAGGVEADERKAAEAADWLERIEQENAGELTPERIAAMEQAAAAGRAERATSEPAEPAPRPSRAAASTARRRSRLVARGVALTGARRGSRRAACRPRVVADEAVGGPLRQAAPRSSRRRSSRRGRTGRRAAASARSRTLATPLPGPHTAPDAHAACRARAARRSAAGRRRRRASPRPSVNRRPGLEARPDLPSGRARAAAGRRRAGTARSCAGADSDRTAPPSRSGARPARSSVCLAVGSGGLRLQPELGVVDRQVRAAAARPRAARSR